MNFYHLVRKLAKSTRAQNLFVAAKELSNIRLFKNTSDFSSLQENYLSYLYIYDSIHRDIVIDKISAKVMDNEIYEDAYLLWKRKKGNKETDSKKDNKNKDVNLVVGKEIHFPTNEVK